MGKIKYSTAVIQNALEKALDSPFEKGPAENSAVLKGSNNQVESPQSVAFGVKNVISQDAPPITEEESPDISEDMTLDGNFVTGKQNVINAGRYSHAEGHKNVASHHYAHVEGYKNEAKGYSSHAEGYSNVSEGSWSHAEGNLSKATGNSSHAEGQQNISSGQSSHAEGRETESTGAASHSEGRKTKAVADWSHAEGFETKSNATYSHAEGSQTETNGGYSHAEGRGTTTTNAGEHAEGWYNKSNTGDTSAQKTIHSVGCGTSKNVRKNAHEIMQDGKHYILGVGGYDGTNPNEAKDVATVVNGKVDKVAGKGLSTNDYTDEDKARVEDVEERISTLDENIHSAAPVVDIVNNGTGEYLRIYHPWMEDPIKNAEVCLMRLTRGTCKRVVQGGYKAHYRGRKYRFFSNLPYGLSVYDFFSIITGSGCIVRESDRVPLRADYSFFFEYMEGVKFVFTQRDGRASCPFGIAVRYENPEFRKLAKDPVRDSVTMINGVKRWIYSEIKPTKVRIHESFLNQEYNRSLGISLLE